MKAWRFHLAASRDERPWREEPLFSNEAEEAVSRSKSDSRDGVLFSREPFGAIHVPNHLLGTHFEDVALQITSWSYCGSPGW